MEAGPNATEQLEAAIEFVRDATAQLAAHVEAEPARERVGGRDRAFEAQVAVCAI